MKALGHARPTLAAAFAILALAACSTGSAPSPQVSSLRTPGAPQSALPDRALVENLARRLISAIRDKDDATLRSLAGARIAGWPDALPAFAAELREHYRQDAGDGAFDLRPAETLVEGDLAAVRCTGPSVPGGRCLVLFFSREPDGWRNHSLRASNVATPLARHLDALKQQSSRSAR